jgi:hypothetical protein
MRSIIYDAVEDEEFGQVGLLPVGIDMRMGRMNASTWAPGVAHDVVEHVNGYGEIGSIEDELEAMGACWFTRGQHWDMSRGEAVSGMLPQEAIGIEIAEMFRRSVNDDEQVRPVANRAGDAEHSFRDCIEQARRYAKHEVEDAERRLFDAYAAAALTRMRLGYRKARRKWGHNANSLFWEIADAAKPVLKGIEEGMSFKLVYGMQGNRAFAKFDEHWADSQG